MQQHKLSRMNKIIINDSEFFKNDILQSGTQFNNRISCTGGNVWSIYEKR